MYLGMDGGFFSFESQLKNFHLRSYPTLPPVITLAHIIITIIIILDLSLLVITLLYIFIYLAVLCLVLLDVSPMSIKT